MKLAVGVVLMVTLFFGASSHPQGGHHKHPKGYFQYVNVPGHKQYEFGWRKGNPHHSISRFEQAKDHRFRTRVKWEDAHGGTGEHYWEYNHAPKHVHNDGGHKGYHSEQVEVVLPPKVGHGDRLSFS